MLVSSNLEHDKVIELKKMGRDRHATAA